jgi:hypothetical protein
MADRVLFMSWGSPVRGAEERGLEVFDDAMGLYGRLQQEGRIEGFDVALLEPTGGIEGYLVLRGSAEQIAAVRADEEFRRMVIDASLIVDDLALVSGFTNEGIAEEMALYQEAISKVPQRA